ncbi:MAG TPA: nickel pincer cofactor biosynthesis protein LarC [Candidatus Dormibacteraeota bacterium]|nr:nickel pincer cofactor biosynthesis protein LarC [Candidatus Dormibacteraeota bacterium]
MRVLYLDCPSGISGDMTLGALLDVGADPEILPRAVTALGLDAEVQVSWQHGERGHLGGTRVLVECGEGPARALPELLGAVERADLPDRVRERALTAIRRIGEVESRVHGVPLERVHLHELGGADTLVDLVGSFWLLESLEVEAVHASPLPAPQAPHSAPATMRILAGSGAVLVPDERHRELVTPTGAVILTTLARFERPAMRLERIGYGLGSRPDPGNATGAWLGESVAETGVVSVIETNLDDMPPNQLAPLAEDLLAAGALDVSITPILMKKGRPGHMVTVIADPERGRELAERLLRDSSTMGVRIGRAERMLAGRRFLEVEVPQGRVRVKVKEIEGRPVEVAPEYEDCRRLGDVREVMRLAAEAARRELGLP